MTNWGKKWVGVVSEHYLFKILPYVSCFKDGFCILTAYQ